jgi:hypothetical protein
MGVLQSCLQTNNKVQVCDVSTVVDDWSVSKGGVTFDLTLGGTKQKLQPKPVRHEKSLKKDNFEEWRGIVILETIFNISIFLK